MLQLRSRLEYLCRRPQPAAALLAALLLLDGPAALAAPPAAGGAGVPPTPGYSAGASTTPAPAPGPASTTPAPAAATPAPAPAQDDPLAEVVALRQSLTTGLESVLQRWRALQPRIEAAGKDAELNAAAIDFDLLRNGLQACFGSVSEGTCEGQAVGELRRYAGTLESALRTRIESRLGEVDALRRELSEVVVRSRLLAEQAGRARQDVERLTQQALLIAQTTDENPLESAPVKARKLEDWRQVQQQRDGVAQVAARVEREARPLETQAVSVRARILDDLALIGAAAGSAAPRPAGTAAPGSAAPLPAGAPGNGKKTR